ncbi:MAG: hypothetical protein IJT13_04180, partial [Bacteroidaceae bacterium]|nr:hypothetical protein [Bacteroidaceae bacterium]
MGTVSIIDSYTRLEEAEGNSPGQRPVVIIVSLICTALKEQKNYAFSIKVFFKNSSARLCRFACKELLLRATTVRRT